MPLVEVYPGLWVRPELVTAVIAFDGHSLFVAETSPQVKVYAGGSDLAGWEFKNWVAAKAFAAKVAAAINAALPAPPLRVDSE